MDAITQARAADLPAILTSYGVKLKKTGQAYLACCIFHDDKNPSMSVYEQGVWRCHCHSCGANEDSIGVIQQLDGCDFKTAVNRLTANGFERQLDRIVPEKQVKAAKWKHVKPPPGSKPDMELKDLGKPSRVWCYRDLDGEPLGYVARYETAEGKTIRPWTYGSMSANIKPKWESKQFSYPRPLYGMERLAQFPPDTQVILHEGEKAADAAQDFLYMFPNLTWPGGSNSVKLADWRVLKGRNVVLWPDNDPAGQKAMMDVGGYLLGVDSE